MKRGHEYLFSLYKGGVEDIKATRGHFLTHRPFFFIIVLTISSTVPKTQEARVLGVPTLHAKKKPKHLKITTKLPLILVIVIQ